jgi:hypothetical protein
MAEESYSVIATSPGDIVLEFIMSGASGLPANVQIPLKSITAQKSTDISPEYGTGSHQAYAHVVGKIGYSGDFTVGTWYMSAEANPSTWDTLIRTFLTFQGDEGLPKEFDIRVQARPGASMISQGTGTYGTNSASGNSSGLTIQTYKRCKLTGDATDIPEVGGTVTRKYSFICMRRDPL